MEAILAEAIENMDMYELAQKTNAQAELSETEAEVVAKLDAHFKAIGKTGCDPNHEIASFIQTVINTQADEAKDELLDLLFERGTIGEFDDYEATITPKNTLVAYEAAVGGNVPRSFVDTTALQPKWSNKQIETEIDYKDLKRGGWKTVANVTEYAMIALRNTMFKEIFASLNDAIVSGSDNYIAESSTKPTQASMDAAALYVRDESESGDGVFVARSKYIQNISKLDNYNFTSPAMMDRINRFGELEYYDGVRLQGISGTKKLGDGTALFPDKVIFGIADKIGTLDMRGDVTVYEEMDNNKEKVVLMFKNYQFGVAFNADTLKKVCKIAIA